MKVRIEFEDRDDGHYMIVIITRESGHTQRIETLVDAMTYDIDFGREPNPKLTCLKVKAIN